MQREQRAHDAERAADEHGPHVVEAGADGGERDAGRRCGERRETHRVEVHLAVDLHLVRAGQPDDESWNSCRDGADREDREHPLVQPHGALFGSKGAEL